MGGDAFPDSPITPVTVPVLAGISRDFKHDARTRWTPMLHAYPLVPAGSRKTPRNQ